MLTSSRLMLAACGSPVHTAQRYPRQEIDRELEAAAYAKVKRPAAASSMDRAVLPPLLPEQPVAPADPRFDLWSITHRLARCVAGFRNAWCLWIAGCPPARSILSTLKERRCLGHSAFRDDLIVLGFPCRTSASLCNNLYKPDFPDQLPY